MRHTVCSPSEERGRSSPAAIVTVCYAARVLCCGLILVLLSGAADATPTPTPTPFAKPTSTPVLLCYLPPAGSTDVATLTVTGVNGLAQGYQLVSPTDHNAIFLDLGPGSPGFFDCSSVARIDPRFIHFASGTTDFAGWLCIMQTYNVCGAKRGTGEIDCNGGGALGFDVLADSNIGHCGGNAACKNKCDTFCRNEGQKKYGSHCALPQHRCECRCITRHAGSSGVPGIAQCYLGAHVTIEAALPCGDGDAFVDFGDHCFPMTTSSTTATIKHADFSQSQIGPIDETGASIPCDQFSSPQRANGLVMDGQVPIIFNPPSSHDVILTLHLPCGSPPGLGPPTNVPSTSEP